MRPCTLSIVLASLLPLAARAQHDDHHPIAQAAAPRLGTVTFPNSGAKSAQAPFLLGVALLHSFEYEDAADEFRLAQRADPNFALAYWLEAVTYSQVLWGVDDPAAARRALTHLAPSATARLAKAPTAREREYGAAVEAYFADTDVGTRVRGFADSMRALADRHPDDLEASAFASIAIQMAVPSLPADQKQAAEERAIAFAERVFEANPNHPGAAHYLIHISDMDAAFAERALPAARAYAKIAPDAEHALHMPSHVFLKLGMWDDDVSSNERAWAASRAWVAKRKLTGADLDFHGFEWLQYGYLQQGRWHAARALIDTARAVLAGVDLATAEHVDARYVTSRLEFMYAVETGQWSEVRDGGPMEAPPGPSAAASREASALVRARYQRAATAAMRGDTTNLASTARSIGGDPDSLPRQGARPMAVMLGGNLAFLSSRARGDQAQMFARLSRAADAEANIPNVGPTWYLSSIESLGAALVAAGKPREAIDAYEHALTHAPNRSSALLGLARARAAAGDRSGAADAYRRLMVNWAHADADLPALAEARLGALQK
jgi:tetratricopeptide (TPR) repeat protein